MSNLIAVNECDKLDAIIPKEEEIKFQRNISELRARGEKPWRFSIVPDFFKQSNIETDDIHFDAINNHFGLSLSSWSELLAKLDKLNKSASQKEVYKLVFCARHGQGYHNKAVEIFGLKAWNDHYSHLESTILEDGTKLIWAPDPMLTEKGIKQAKIMHDVWVKEIKEFGCPIPTKLFSSPFTRSAQTLTITMNGISIFKDGENEQNLLNGGERLRPLVMENLRETIGSHLCDKRSSKEVFSERMAGWKFEFEKGFKSEDVLYRDDWREPISEQALRADQFFQDIFENYDDKVIYCASHAGEIKAIIAATGHRSYSVPTAGMIPMLIKGTRV